MKIEVTMPVLGVEVGDVVDLPEGQARGYLVEGYAREADRDATVTASVGQGQVTGPSLPTRTHGDEADPAQGGAPAESTSTKKTAKKSARKSA